MGILRQIALGAVALLVSTAGAVALSTGTASGQCGTSAIPASATSTLGAVAGYSGDQLANAVAIANAGTALGVSTQGDIIGVMTAIGTQTEDRKSTRLNSSH